MATKVKGEAIKEDSIPLRGLKPFIYELYDAEDYAEFKNAIKNKKSGFIIIQDYSIFQEVYITNSRYFGGNNYRIEGIANGKFYINNFIDISDNPTIIFKTEHEIKPDVPNWNAQEGEPGYIENKPFSDESHKLEWYYDDNYGACAANSQTDTVIINGIEYVIPDYDSPDNSILDIEINNIGFGFTYNYADNLIVVFGSNEENIDLLINNVLVGGVKQLDEKFIPDTIARKSDIPNIDPIIWKYMCNPIVITSLDDTLPMDILETDDSDLTYIKSQYAGFIRGGFNVNKQKYVEACAVLDESRGIYDRVYIGDINDCANLMSDGTFIYA